MLVQSFATDVFIASHQISLIKKIYLVGFPHSSEKQFLVFVVDNYFITSGKDEEKENEEGVGKLNDPWRFHVKSLFCKDIIYSISAQRIYSYSVRVLPRFPHGFAFFRYSVRVLP
jgi:hypothetical protein